MGENLVLLGPIFRAEVVTAARRRRYFVLRFVYASLMLFLLWSVWSSANFRNSFNASQFSIRQSAELMTGLFFSFSWLQTLAIMTVVPAMAAGTIATERQRRTIEYLFATDLSNAEIVLGKTAGRLALVGQFVAVGLPILFLLRLLGGIPARLLVVTFLFAASSAVMLTALSVCVSVWSRRSRDAIVRIYLLLVVLIFLPIVLRSAFGWGLFNTQLWNAVGKPIVETSLQINPILTLGNAIGNRAAIGMGLDLRLVFTSIGYQLLVSVASLALATAGVRRVHLGETTRNAVENRRRWRIPRWTRPLGNRPMIWKEMFSNSATTRLGWVGNVALGLILVTVLIFAISTFVSAWMNTSHVTNRVFYNAYEEFSTAATIMLGTGVLLMLAARAAGLVTHEKEADCWMSLIATPLAGREILAGKMTGNLYAFRWALAMLLIVWGLGILLNPGSLWSMLVTLATLLLLAWFVSNLGIWFSLRSQTTLRAMGTTLATLVFVGGGYMFCCCVILTSSGIGGSGTEFVLAPCIPFLIGFPTIFYQQWDNRWTEEFGLPIAYGCGVAGYAIVSLLLHFEMISQFDKLVGRSHWTGDESSVQLREEAPSAS